MSRITIRLFGHFSLRREEEVIAGFQARKLQEFFCYLLLHRHHPLAREALASLFWPETTTAQSKKRLRQMLWHLQSALGSQQEPPAERLLLVEPEWVQLNTAADLWLDIAVFEQTFERVQPRAGHELDAQQMQAVQQAIHLYQGPLLEDCYQEWCLNERERLQHMYLAMLEQLMHACEGRHDYESALLYGMQILRCDQAHERIHRRLMRLYYLKGDRTAAIRQYEQCATFLDEALGVKPSKRTIALYKQILSDQLIEPGSLTPPFTPQKVQPVLASSPAPLVETLECLRCLEQSLTDCQRQVQQSIQRVEHALCETHPLPLPPTDEGKERRFGDAQETVRDASNPEERPGEDAAGDIFLL
jgi:DNA-binding SARP family transcriptional activator